MKKSIILAATILAISFTSCGSSEEKKEGEDKAPTVCECMETMEEMMQEAEGAGGDEEKMKAIEEKYKSKADACKKLAEGLSPEETEKLQEEARNCK